MVGLPAIYNYESISVIPSKNLTKIYTIPVHLDVSKQTPSISTCPTGQKHPSAHPPSQS